MVAKLNIFMELEILLRLMISVLLGYLIGYERKSKEKDAGMRTHAIVCLGAALFMIISKYGFSDTGNYDSSRIASQVVTGIGFLGAGLIFIRDNTVSGLTTAAGIWATAGVGLAIGAGMYIAGISAGVFILIIQALLNNIPLLSPEPTKGRLRISLKEEGYEEFFYQLLEYMQANKIKVDGLSVEKKSEVVEIKMDLLYPHGYNKENLISSIIDDIRVTKISG